MRTRLTEAQIKSLASLTGLDYLFMPHKTVKTDWLKLESSIRRVYDILDAHSITEEEALVLIGECVGYHTGRGYPVISTLTPV